MLIGGIDILPSLFETILIPSAVWSELHNPNTPPVVWSWIDNPPIWLEVLAVSSNSFNDNALDFLDQGEKEAIRLALALKADLVLMDDQEGVAAARNKGLIVNGTIGILFFAAQRGLIDLAEMFERLRRTSFRCPENIMEALLAQQKQTRQ